MRQFIPLAFIAGVIALGFVAVRDGGRVEEAQAGTAVLLENYAPIAHPDRVLIYRLEQDSTSIAPDPDAPLYRNNPLAVRMVGDPVVAKDDWAAELAKELAKPQTHAGEPEPCIPNPGIRVEFMKDQKKCHVYFCFECHLVGIGDPKSLRWTGFQQNNKALAQLMKEAFPVDQEIQALSEANAPG